MQTFLWLNIFLLLPPLAFSFHKKIEFYKQFLFVLPAIVFSASLFILWDSFFTAWGVWQFNPEKILGIYWFGLPMEEVFLYFTLPFLCLFVFHITRIFIKKDFLEPVQQFITALLLLFTLTLFYVFNKKMYTAMASLVVAFILLFRMWIANKKSLGYFYKSLVICLIPFLIVNLILVKIPVINYQEMFVVGVKVFGIPIENLISFLALYLCNVGIYDFFKKRFSKQITVTEITEVAEAPLINN